MRINYNVSAMLSNNALANNDKLLSQSLQRLSSGLKINRAKDNPAGLAMAKRMNAQLEGLAVANQNASDGISIIETADGAMSEVSEMLQRLNELAIKAANGTMADSDRGTVQDEVKQLKEEINRISEVTEFNGQKLLNGEFEWKGFVYDDDPLYPVSVSGYSKEVPAKRYQIDSVVLEKEYEPVYEKDPKTGEFIKDPVTGNYIVTEYVETGEYIVKGFQLLDYDPNDPAKEDGFPNAGDIRATIKGNLLTFTGVNDFEMTLDLTEAKPEIENQLTAMGDTVTIPGFTVDASGIGAMRLQIGANEGQVLEIDIPAISLRNLGIEDVDVSTKEGALDAIEAVDGAVRFVSAVRGQLGAYQNRLESTVNSLDITSENMTAAYSRIMDVDMAEEMTKYTTYQVLTQAGTSMLAQANERPSQVLQLLQ